MVLQSMHTRRPGRSAHGDGGLGRLRAKRRRTSTRARTSISTSATAPAAATTSMPACSPATWAQHIPGNPTVVPKNMTGAGSLVLANWLYNVAPKDGTAFGMIGRGTAFDPILGNEKAKFDGTKFTWIGSMNDEVSVCVAWHNSGRHQIRGSADQGAGGRRHRRSGRHRPVSENAQRRARHQVQDRHRLSGRQRSQSRDGARRSEGPLRLVMVERQVAPT